jgi:hypothetical protein
VNGAGEPRPSDVAAVQAAAQQAAGVWITPDGTQDLQHHHLPEPVVLPEGPTEHSKHQGGDDDGYPA